ncbi:MAG TPA: hypothetical protein VFA03_08595 [Acetobacteraceae bacterium]|nr:hypothetical protein [Acetobacteraceae bacterium]
MDVNIKEVDNISPVEIASIDKIAPIEISSIDKVEKIAPVAVHIKELNQVEPLLVESLRIDRLREIDPLSVDRLNVTRLPVVNLSVNQVPEVAIGVSSIPPVAIAVQQCFDMPSDYTARAQFLGFEVLRLRLTGTTRVIPRDRARREQAHAHERSFPLVAAAGNPAIPSRREERCAEAVKLPRAMNAGPPRFSYAARG